MGGSETKNKLPLLIDPTKYLGKDLRDLPEDEIQQIVADYSTLRDIPDGYVLGQKVMALQAVRNGVKVIPSFQEMLDEKERWVFKGSKATQEKNKKT